METCEKVRELNHSSIDIYSIVAFDERLILGSIEFILVRIFRF